ncbi:MAG: hypothetical protein PHT12_01505 [Patescibacteria group bacterium]|nr:hypothetical protein [Patescibacteria group bacterium]
MQRNKKNLALDIFERLDLTGLSIDSCLGLIEEHHITDSDLSIPEIKSNLVAFFSNTFEGFIQRLARPKPTEAFNDDEIWTCHNLGLLLRLARKLRLSDDYVQNLAAKAYIKALLSGRSYTATCIKKIFKFPHAKVTRLIENEIASYLLGDAFNGSNFESLIKELHVGRKTLTSDSLNDAVLYRVKEDIRKGDYKFAKSMVKTMFVTAADEVKVAGVVQKEKIEQGDIVTAIEISEIFNIPGVDTVNIENRILALSALGNLIDEGQSVTAMKLFRLFGFKPADVDSPEMRELIIKEIRTQLRLGHKNKEFGHKETVREIIKTFAPSEDVARQWEKIRGE